MTYEEDLITTKRFVHAQIQDVIYLIPITLVRLNRTRNA